MKKELKKDDVIITKGTGQPYKVVKVTKTQVTLEHTKTGEKRTNPITYVRQNFSTQEEFDAAKAKAKEPQPKAEPQDKKHRLAHLADEATAEQEPYLKSFFGTKTAKFPGGKKAVAITLNNFKDLPAVRQKELQQEWAASPQYKKMKDQPEAAPKELAADSLPTLLKEATKEQAFYRDLFLRKKKTSVPGYKNLTGRRKRELEEEWSTSPEYKEMNTNSGRGVA